MEDPIRVHAEGALLGALVGDASGATLEFKTDVPPPLLETALAMRGGGVWRLAPGQITDDGELSLSLATALVEGKNEFDADQIAITYSKWVDSRPFDIGTTTKKALGIPISKKAGAAALMRAAAKQHSSQSQSNGSLMRCTPLAVWAHRFSPEEIAEVCFAECSFTHHNPTIVHAYTCYILAIVHLIRHPKDRRGAWAAVQDWANKYAEQETREWLKAAEDQVRVPSRPNIGWAKIGFVYAFQQLLKGSSYLEALRDVFKEGGDTDTNGAIVGGLIGAAVGVHEIPKEMRDAVLRCDISLGEQKDRPDWLRTAYSFRRLFIPLFDFAPSHLEFSKQQTSPTRTPGSSPLRSLSPTRLFGNKKQENEAAKGSSKQTSSSSSRMSPESRHQPTSASTHNIPISHPIHPSSVTHSASHIHIPSSSSGEQALGVPTITTSGSSPRNKAAASGDQSLSGGSAASSPRGKAGGDAATTPPQRIASPPLGRQRGLTGESSNEGARKFMQATPVNAPRQGNAEALSTSPFRVLSMCTSTQSKVNAHAYVPNELRDLNNRSQRIAALIAAIQPDLVALQEVEDAMWLSLRTLLDEYDSHFVLYTAQRDGICFLWRKQRWSLSQASSLTLAPSKSSAIAAIGLLKDTETGEEVCFVTTQLSSDPHKEGIKTEEIKALLNHLGGQPTNRIIIAADLGAPAYSSAYEAFGASQQHFLSAYNDANKKEVQCTSFTETGKTAFEFLFFQPRSLRAVPRSAKFYSSSTPLPNALWPSTHLPLVCDFSSINK